MMIIFNLTLKYLLTKFLVGINQAYAVGEFLTVESNTVFELLDTVRANK